MTGSPIRILVIDDEPPIRKLLRTGLGTQGYDVLEAPNGKAALELIGEGTDLIILDLGLPDVAGLELLGQFIRTSPCTHQSYQLTAEHRRIRRSRLRHGGHLLL